MSGYYNTDINAESIVGSITNRGTVSQSLNASGSYTIPAGYHNGSGKITANALSSQTSADAAAGNILATKTAWVNGSQITGSMTNQGSKSTSLNAGRSYTVPAGYHDGTGKITANTLASQTAGTAAAGHILSGKTAWVAGSRLTGTLAVQNISSVTATTQSSSVIRISWKNPAKGPYTGVKIFMSTSGNPGTSGTAKYTGTGSSTTASGTSYVDITGLSGATKYYFTVCAYVTNVGNGTASNINATTKAAAGSKTFTSSGTFTVPAGITSIDIFCVGGGGASCNTVKASSTNTDYTGVSAGGGGGYTSTKKGYAVTPGASFTVTIGAGGTAGGNGSATSFGSILTANGGNSASATAGWHNGSVSTPACALGGNGGSGGASGRSVGSGSTNFYGGKGGSDGSNGDDTNTNNSTNIYLGNKLHSNPTASLGQHTTTRAFGETSGTLYAGGGGCGYTVGGDGGGGNAGITQTENTDYESSDGDKWYSYRLYIGNAGAANTGGGGGGSRFHTTHYKNQTNISRTGVSANGGSGICIIRWS